MYVLGYGIGRYWIEGLRIDNVQLDDVAGLRWNQWVALAAILGGAGYLFATRGQRDTEVGADAADDAADGTADENTLDDDAADDENEVDESNTVDEITDDDSAERIDDGDIERDAAAVGALDDPVPDGAVDESTPDDD